MGHKVHPTGFRIGVIRDWDAKWYADKHYKEYLQEDLKLRKEVRSMYPEAGVSLIEIDRQANNVALTIHTARPGILIGRGGQRVDEMRVRLEGLIGKRIQLNIREIPQPELDAYLVARSIAEQIERRIAYRRTLKQSMSRSIQAGAKGMRVSCAGRLDGAEIARRVTMHEGQVPLHTLRADIDYGFTEARTTMGRIGVKVWIYKGEILPAPSIEEEEEMSAETAEEPKEEAAPVKVVEEESTQPAVTEAVETALVEDTTKDKTEEAPVEAVGEAKAEAAPAVTEEKKPVKRAPRKKTKVAPSAEAGAEKVEEALAEAVGETKAEAEPAVTEEKKPVKRAPRKKTRAVPSAEAGAEKVEEAPAEAVEETKAEAAPAVTEEKKPAKRAPRKKTKAETSAEAEVEKSEDTAAKTETDKSADIDIATNQEESDATT